MSNAQACARVCQCTSECVCVCVLTSVCVDKSVSARVLDLALGAHTNLLNWKGLTLETSCSWKNLSVGPLEDTRTCKGFARKNEGRM